MENAFLKNISGRLLLKYMNIRDNNDHKNFVRKFSFFQIFILFLKKLGSYFSAILKKSFYL